MFSNCCQANTIEITIDYNLPTELNYEQISVEKLKIIGAELRKFVIENEVFNAELYSKLNSFIINNKKSLSSLTALSMIAELCLLNDTYDLYSVGGEKIINYLITDYKKYVHGKIALLAKATLLENQQLRENAIKLLEENYEILISVENDPNFKTLISELNLNGTDVECFSAGYFYKLGYNYEMINDFDNAQKNYNKIIKQFPKTNYAIRAKERLLNLN